MVSSSKPVVIGNCLFVKIASEHSGFSQQYLRRLLRMGRLAGSKLGQVWLVEMETLEAYLFRVGNSQDRRFGPK
jgi:hypothetical protein